LIVDNSFNSKTVRYYIKLSALIDNWLIDS